MKPVPNNYRGVWQRDLLQTPTMRDDSSFVRWMQTSHWHADLRVPDSFMPLKAENQQGFCGVTLVEKVAERQVCTWHRRMDFQPPRLHIDAGVMRFPTLDTVEETGVHTDYFEAWSRLPDSTGRFIALAGLDEEGNDSQSRLLLAGRYLMYVRPRAMPWPLALPMGQSLADLIFSQPELKNECLDFEISFGTLDAGVWRIEQSTLQKKKSQSLALTIIRSSPSSAITRGSFVGVNWQVLEWTCTDSAV
jgi:hypothetical protein